MPDTAGRLPAGATLFAAQIRYQARLLVAGGRSLVMGIGLPVILLIASDQGTDAHSNVAGFAVFGPGILAWSGYGIRLVADREAGILKRWRATPLPRWCYLGGRIVSGALVAVLAGAVTNRRRRPALRHRPARRARLTTTICPRNRSSTH